jgi:hypothetical protein
MLTGRPLPLAGRWSGGQARDEIDQIAGHPLRLLPQHEVTGVVVLDESRARDGDRERFLVLLNQQVVALSPDDQGGYGDRSRLCRRHCGQAVELAEELVGQVPQRGGMRVAGIRTGPGAPRRGVPTGERETRMVPDATSPTADDLACGDGSA